MYSRSFVTLSFGTFVCLKLILVNSVWRIMEARPGWHPTMQSIIVKRRRLHCALPVSPVWESHHPEIRPSCI